MGSEGSGWRPEQSRRAREKAEGIPEELLKLQRFLQWDTVVRNGKATKKPRTKDGTWDSGHSFDEVGDCEISAEHGIGLDMSGRIVIDGLTLVGVDMDSCRNAETGELEQWAVDVLDFYDWSFTEITPSGCGLRLWLWVKNPPPGGVVLKVHAEPTCEKTPEMQLFGLSPRSFVTMTLDPLPESEREILCVDDLSWLLDTHENGAVLTGDEKLPVGEGKAPSVESILRKVLLAPRGADMVDGKWEQHDYESASHMWFALIRHALACANNHGAAVVDFLLEATQFGRGLVESKDPDRYMRREWVERDVARIAVKVPTSSASVFEEIDEDNVDVPEQPKKQSLILTMPAVTNWHGVPLPQRYLLRHPSGKGMMPLGEAMSLTAAGGVGKTMAVMQLAIAIATGRKWLGHFEVDELVVGRASLLLLGEEKAAQVHRRMHYLVKSMGLTPAEQGAVQRLVHIVPLAGCVVPFLKPGENGTVDVTRHLKAVHARLKAGKDWGLITVDPQARFAGVDVEKDNALATLFVQVCEQIVEAAPGNPSVMVVAHSSKFARRAGQADARGVTGLTDAFRFHATLVTRWDSVVWEVVKNNYAAPSEPVTLERCEHGMLVVETAATRARRETEEAAELAALTDTKIARLEKVLEEMGGSAKMSKENLAIKMGGKRATARMAIDHAVAVGRIHRIDHPNRVIEWTVFGSAE